MPFWWGRPISALLGISPQRRVVDICPKLLLVLMAFALCCSDWLMLIIGGDDSAGRYDDLPHFVTMLLARLEASRAGNLRDSVTVTPKQRVDEERWQKL